jgi:hypothetical protein
MLSRLRDLSQKFAASRLATFLLYFAIFWAVAAATNAGFVAKWGLRDKWDIFGIEAMLDGTAKRPFVYRQLAPLVANVLDRQAPDSWKAEFEQLAGRLSNSFSTVATSDQPEFSFRYRVVYYLSFFSLLISLFLLRRILIEWGLDEGIALIAPIAFVLLTPYLQTEGGYFYDSIELLFFSAGFLLASRGKIAALIALTVPATINKESYFFFLATLYPLLRHVASRRDASIGIGAAMSVSLAVGLIIKFLFRDAPGGIVEFNLLHNLEQFSHLSFYFRGELTYGIIGPRGAFVGTLLFLAIVALRGWPPCNPVIKQHIVISAAVTLPLALLFAYPGELRNLSILYVGFVVLLGYALRRAHTSSGGSSSVEVRHAPPSEAQSQPE